MVLAWAVQVTFVFAAEVVPSVNPKDGTRLYLTYSGVMPEAGFVVKRTTGVPTSESVWTELSGFPAEDTGLTFGTEYTYALFSDSAGHLLPNQHLYSQIPNRQMVESAGARVTVDEGGQAGTPQKRSTRVSAGSAGETAVGQKNQNGAEDTGVATSDATVATFLERVSGILNTLVPFIVGLAVFVIIWGIFTYITQASNEEKREEAKKYILWGVVGVFMMLSVWGFVNILLNTFELDKQIDSETIPKVPTIVAPAAP